MASYLRPRRGTLSASSSIVLKKGEVFFEFKDNPATTSGGTSCGCIKMGNGTTVYNSLGYFLNPTTDVVTWASTTASGLPSDWGSYGGSTATSASQGSDLYDDLNALISGDQNMKVFPLIKNLLYKLCTQVTKLNNEYIANHTIKQLQLTPVPELIINNSYVAYRIGKIVMIQLVGLTGNFTINIQVIYNGAPKPVGVVANFTCYYQGIYRGGILVDASGAVQVRLSAPENNVPIYGSIVYITYE